MGSFKLVGVRLNCVFEEQTTIKTKVIDVCTCTYIAASNSMGSFVTQWHKKHAQLHIFYTNARILIPAMTFYDAKPQLVKTPIAA